MKHEGILFLSAMDDEQDESIEILHYILSHGLVLYSKKMQLVKGACRYAQFHCPVSYNVNEPLGSSLMEANWHITPKMISL